MLFFCLDSSVFQLIFFVAAARLVTALTAFHRFDYSCCRSSLIVLNWVYRTQLAPMSDRKPDDAAKLDRDVLEHLLFEIVDPVEVAESLLSEPKHALTAVHIGWDNISIDQFCALY